MLSDLPELGCLLISPYAPASVRKNFQFTGRSAQDLLQAHCSRTDRIACGEQKGSQPLPQ